MVDFFKLKERKTNVRTEIIAGLATFMTMAYIVFVNPDILSAAMGVEYKEALIVATALAAGLMTLAMGLFANYPFALASGMGLNAVLAFTVIKGLGLSWRTAMAIVVIEGLIVTALVLTRTREAVMNAIPTNLKRGIGVGIGLFLGFIGLKGAGIVTASPATLVTAGEITRGVAVALIGLLVTGLLLARRVKGSILLGIILTTCIAWLSDLLSGNAGGALVQIPREIIAFPRAEHFKTFFQFDLAGALQVGLIGIILSFMVTDFFDTMGTVVAVGGEGGFLDKQNRLPGLNRVLLVDAMAAVVGGAFGCSSVTTYVESAAGVSEGGRTGLTSVVVGILFLLSIFFYPIIGIVPTVATAPALIVVGYLMMRVVKEMEWKEFDEAFPAFLTTVLIPLTYNVSTGIGWGFISYTFLKTFRGKFKDVHPLMYVISAVFLLVFLYKPLQKAGILP
ncbi:MAG: NCS2 family permease [Bacillota bacterium]